MSKPVVYRQKCFPRNASKAVKGEYVDWRGRPDDKLRILGLGKMGSAFALNHLSKGNEVTPTIEAKKGCVS